MACAIADTAAIHPLHCPAPGSLDIAFCCISLPGILCWLAEHALRLKVDFSMPT